MALESISSASSTMYTDAVKQNVNKVPQVKASEEAAKKSTAVQKPSMTAPKPSAAQNTSNAAAEAKAAVPAEDQEEENVSSKMKDAIDKVNQKIVPTKTRCEFSYHEETKRVSIKVIDQSTEEVIKEIPPEETLDMLSKVWELAGLLVDERR